MDNQFNLRQLLGDVALSTTSKKLRSPQMTLMYILDAWANSSETCVGFINYINFIKDEYDITAPFKILKAVSDHHKMGLNYYDDYDHKIKNGLTKDLFFKNWVLIPETKDCEHNTYLIY